MSIPDSSSAAPTGTTSTAGAATTSVTTGHRLGRVEAIDLYRGVIMVIMLLDHTRERVHLAGMTENATDPATTNLILFATRWITHLCAPAFVLLAGTSAGLMRERGVGASELSRYLLTRGSVLILLEFFVVRPLLLLNVNPMLFAVLETIWAIGCSMLVLSLLVYLPTRMILAVGVLIVFGHNLLDGITVQGFAGPTAPVTLVAKVWIVLHQGGLFMLPLYPAKGMSGPIVFAAYPILPWIGVMALGYCLATLYSKDAPTRKRTFAVLGVAMLALFIVLRGFNLYGDPQPWTPQATALQTVFSFLNLQKYPPSLLFLLPTLAPCLLALAGWDAKPLASAVSRWFMTFGRVPMFFFLIQWIWVHLAGALTSLAYHQSLAGQHASLTDYFVGSPPPVSGGPMWLVYLAWILGAIVLYFPCRWYGHLRAQRRDIALLRYI